MEEWSKANHPRRNHFGLAACAASVVVSGCSCRSPWVPLGPLGFVLGLGLGSGEWAPRLSPRVTRAVYCLCATCLSVCLCGCSGWACRQLSGWLCACFRDIGPREEEGCVRGGGMRTGSMGPHISGRTYGPIGAYYGPI